MLGIENADAQTAEMGGNFRSDIAVLGPVLRRIAFVGSVFAKHGPTPVSAAGSIIGADQLPDRGSFVLAAILARTEGYAYENERLVRRELVPSL